LSFSSGNRNSGGKGNSGGKKLKRKKQEFHEHKLRRSDDGATNKDPQQLKERVIMALDRLGHQKFSTEQGGYGLENWMKNFKLLLDDYEEDIGKANLPIDYPQRREELTATLLKPIDTSAVDKEIEGIKREEEELTKKRDDERTRLNGKLEALRAEQAKVSNDLAEYRRRLAKLNGSGKKSGEGTSRTFLKRLLGGGTSSVPREPIEDKLKELDSSLESLRREILAQQRIRGLLNELDAPPDSPYAEEQRKLESLRTTLQKLEALRTDMVQLTLERERVASAIAGLISGISLSGEKTGGDTGAPAG
jgi:hypothetical protein